MNRSTPLVVLTAATVAAPVAVPWIALADGGSIATAASTSTSRLVSGPAVGMRWGPVTVRIRVRGRTFTNVGATYPNERPKSASINERAIPILRQEALRAHSARIHAVSGATLTSRAFSSSLQAAITRAHL
ncbi:MAG: hypothetical protein QOJ35_2617 [Solirubrobacteraceae bacterium]|jgi:uncharacterized protein with FMN-binding domain|nr:hypothetical protein [Solirubrobacteraceae bacterium]